MTADSAGHGSAGITYRGRRSGSLRSWWSSLSMRSGSSPWRGGQPMQSKLWKRGPTPRTRHSAWSSLD